MQCDHACFNPCALRVHLKTHSGEKLNKCSQCDFASSRAGHLRTHLMTHSGEKPNKCNQCEYASSRASNLRTHLKTHSEEKLNKCSQCKYASSRTDSLRRHLKIHSGGNVKEKEIWKYIPSIKLNRSSCTLCRNLCQFKIICEKIAVDSELQWNFGASATTRNQYIFCWKIYTWHGPFEVGPRWMYPIVFRES